LIAAQHEQSVLLEGSLEDDEGEVLAGDYVWRPRGNRHVARSPKGALVLCFFLKPNIFLDGEIAGQQLNPAADLFLKFR
jgi:hypothetical protein